MAFKIIKPDSADQTVDENATKCFLAGSIDDGKASLWAHDVQQGVSDLDVTLFNPRREVWYPDIEARMSNPLFNGQVNWELDHIERADCWFFYFEPGSLSPITFQEFGFIVGHLGDRFISYNGCGYEVHPPVICCPDGFWRKGNVEVMCHRAKLPLYNDLPSAIDALRDIIALDRKWKAHSTAS